MTGCIVGWAHTRFGRLEDHTIESLITTVAREAIADAGLEPGDIDQIYLGNFNGGMVEQDFPSSLVLQADDALRFTPVTRVENACATGSAAIYQGLNALAAKKARFVLAVGAEKMTAASTAKVTEVLARASYYEEEAAKGITFPGMFGNIAQQYFQRHGDQMDGLARVAAKNHKNGSVNPYAHMQKDLGYEFCRSEGDKNPMVAAPLKRTDCSMISDGAAAVVLADTDQALGLEKAIAFRANAQVNDFLPVSRRDILAYEGPQRAFAQAFEQSGLKLEDLDLVEVHDCFTIAEMLSYEAMGLCQPGQAARALEEGWTEKDGKLPVNPSGGLKAKGHPIGATGVSMHAMTAMQLAGQAGDMQVKDASRAGVFNMGGAAVASYVSILEPIR